MATGMTILLLSLLMTAGSRVGELRTFEDWIVGCDNLHVCHATTLNPESTEEEVAKGKNPPADNFFNLSIKRAAGAKDQPRVRLFDCYQCEPEAGREPELARELRVKDVTGAVLVRRLLLEREAFKLASDDGLPVSADGDLIEALGKGETVEVLDGEDGIMATISLRGLGASMRLIDENQHRTSNVTALIARGPTNVDRAPPWIPEPIIYTPSPSDLPPVRLAGKKLVKLQQKYRCGRPDSGLPKPTYERLDERTTMLLLFANCSPYNGEGYVFLISEAQRIHPAPIRITSMGPSLELPQVASAYWDQKARRLHSFGRGRALADCGQDQAFAWDGDQFILVEEADMGECRGSIDYITVYRRETAVRGQRR
ncbi:MAG: DUF1176 domain-containing protein [Blastomonas sp.]|uniref:DUF1176 domain-containing protein n=1 Tax=Blastomonas sp. TaxID=1909299 RepID=UPI00406A301A|nr:DUF1176 domain-containing protein [Blastomonas sp.]